MYKSIIFCVCISYVSANVVRVDAPQGSFLGETHDGYTTFFGLPYARLDSVNPFGPSLPVYKYDKKRPYFANDTVMCPQAVYKRSNFLQCLRLNIYVPKVASISNKVPILVWFHGGGFAFGSGGEYGGQHLVKRGIIVITVNFRLGPYGFFCLNERTPGNQGLKDQIVALKWIKKNIIAFGGNPHLVTIAGESYGGGAVELHLYSEYEKLFDKVIIQSGSIFDEGFYVRPDHRAANKIAKYLGKDYRTVHDSLKFLTKLDPEIVMSAALNLSLPMAVCKEKRSRSIKNFVTRDPFNLRKTNKLTRTKIMVGYTNMELLFYYADQGYKFYEDEGDVFYNMLKKNFNMRKKEIKVVSGVLKQFYLGEKPIGPETVLELSEAASDFIINSPTERSIDKMLSLETDITIYKYVFSYTGGSPYRNISGAGASHTEELKYLFEWETPIEDEEQEMMRKRMTMMWANFVKFGNPTPKVTELLPVTWEPVVGTARPYMNIDVEMSMGDHIYRRRIAFWDMFWHHYKKHSLVYSP